MEGRGVKTYCGKLLLRSFPEKPKRPGGRVSPAAGTGTLLGSERFYLGWVLGLGCPVRGSPRLDTLLRPLLSCLGECSRTDSGGAAWSPRCSGPPGICAGLVPGSVSSPAGERGASRLRGPQAGCVEFLRRRLPWEMCLGNEILPITVLPRGERASFNYSSPNRLPEFPAHPDLLLEGDRAPELSAPRFAVSCLPRPGILVSVCLEEPRKES